MDENLYLSQLTVGESCALMLELRPEPQTITLPSKLNHPEPEIRKAAHREYYDIRKSLSEEQWNQVIITRRAKRKADTIAYQNRLAEEKAAEKARTAAYRQRMAEEAAAAKLEAKSLRVTVKPSIKREPAGMEPKLCKIPVKVFVPVIHGVNPAGETRVQVDAKTSILVGPGKDIQKAIANYQSYLLKSA